jgi:hypothetical protein
MDTLAVYGRLYAKAAAAAWSAAWKSPWTLLLPLIALAADVTAFILVAPLGVLAGIAMALVQAALLSGYFYFVLEALRGSRVDLSELGKSLGAYLWSFVNLAFVVWVARLVLSTVAPGILAGPVGVFLEVAAFILLNAAPEAITQRGTYGGLATIQASVEFIQENWLVWLLPNVVLGVLLFLVLPPVQTLLLSAVFGARGVLLTGIVFAVTLSAGLHLLFLFRAFLFRELAGSSHRQRLFKHRTQ